MRGELPSIGRALVIVLVFCSWPFTNFFGANIDELLGVSIPFARVLVGSIESVSDRLMLGFWITVGAAVSLTAALKLSVRSLSYPRAAFYVGAVVMAWFNYYSFYELVGLSADAHGLGILVWLGFLAVMLVIGHLVGRSEAGRFIATGAVFGMSMFALLNGIDRISPSNLSPEVAEVLAFPRDIPAQVDRTVRRPNIYYFMPDSYPSNHVLKRFYHFDNSAFTDSLAELGMYVAQDTYSNYPVTLHSLGTALSMDYRPKPGLALVESQYYEHAARLLASKQMAVIAFLRNRGYRYAHVENGMLHRTVCTDDEDVCIRKGKHLMTSQEVAILRMTPAVHFANLLWRLLGVGPGATRADDVAPTYSLFKSLHPRDLIELFPSQELAPYFLFAHFPGTHSYYLDAGCGYMPPHHRSRTWPDGPSLRESMADQITCYNTQLLELFRYIIQEDPDALIVLQSDTGSFDFHDNTLGLGPRRKQVRFTEPALVEAFGIMNAYRLPDACRSRLYPSISPVNSFRVILGCIDGTEYALKPDIQYVATYPDWASYGEVIAWEPQ